MKGMGMRYRKNRSCMILHAESHVSGMNFQCKLCTEKCPTRYRLRSHHYKAHSKPPSKMRISSKSSKSSVQQKELDGKIKQLYALVDGSYVCLECGKTFQRPNHIFNHCETHLGNINECKECKAQFKSRQTLKIHLKQKHNNK